DGVDDILAMACGALRGIGGLATGDLFLGRVILCLGGSAQECCECEGSSGEEEARGTASGSCPVFKGVEFASHFRSPLIVSCMRASPEIGGGVRSAGHAPGQFPCRPGRPGGRTGGYRDEPERY